jgi:hypothetical protein
MSQQNSFSKQRNAEPREPVTAIEPSRELRQLVCAYYESVDAGKGAWNVDAVAQLQEQLLDRMQAERIPFNSARQALWIARWLYAGEPSERGRQTTILFARTPPHYHETEYDPIRDGVRELTAMPYADPEDERANGARRIPVLVTVEPLRDYCGATYER